MANKCTYSVAWVGTCNNQVDSQSEDRCSKHMDKTCVVCGDKATNGCSETIGLVCGAPLCDDRDCYRKHQSKAHGWDFYDKKEKKLDPDRYHLPK